MGQSTKTSANCSKMAEPNGSNSLSDEGYRQASPPLKDKIVKHPKALDMSKYKVIEDEFMEEQNFKVYWVELTRQVHIFRRGMFLAIAKDYGIFQAHTDVLIDADFWDFESKEDMAFWSAVILAEVAVAREGCQKNKVKHVYSQLSTESQSNSSNSQDNPVASMQPVKRKIISMLKGGEQLSLKLQKILKVAQDIRATFEWIMKREKLFEEISCGGANVIFPVPKVKPALPEEKSYLARSALESAVAVNQGVA
ncbi:MAG: hypothetical protein EZS28_050745, partial [Streblomastix strix]